MGTTLLATTRTYALALNWSLFPLSPKSKRPDAHALHARGYVKVNDPDAGGWGKLQTVHPVEEDLEAWFGHETENVAIVTGAVSNLVVLDIDGVEGRTSLEGMPPLPNTPRVKTSDGMHYYFQHPGFSVRNFVKKRPGMDLRGDGGYVVAPPSIHPSGMAYEWEVSPFDVDPSPLPDWILDMLRESPTYEAQALTPLIATSYGRAALDNEIKLLGEAQPGTRNAQLNRAAFSLGSLIEGRELAEVLVLTRLREVATEIGLSSDEIEPTIQSGLRAGKAEPRTAPLAYTEQGNASRFALQNQQEVRFVTGKGAWFIWDGRRWTNDEDLKVHRLGKATLRSIYSESRANETEEQAKARFQWGRKSESLTALTNMLALAKSEGGLAVPINQFDADEWQLNVLNGTINLKTGVLLDHRREDLNTKIAPVVYRPDAVAPTWDRFLKTVFRADEELIHYVQKAVGYTLTGLTTEQVLFFLFGTGKNGKTTLVETLRAIMGDYAQKAPIDMLMARPNAGVPNDVARLAGSRLVIASEVEEDKRIAEAILKDLTGGDTVVARFLHHEFFEFRPSHKLWIYGNHKPIIRGTDMGIWRRIKLIPFKVQISNADEDQQLPRKLLAESSGILNWAIKGLYAWRDEGLGAPSVVTAETEAYRQDMDVLGTFLEETIETDPEAKTAATLLYNKYVVWSEMQKSRPMTQTSFGRKMAERNFEKLRTRDGQVYAGIKVKDTAQA